MHRTIEITGTAAMIDSLLSGLGRVVIWWISL